MEFYQLKKLDTLRMIQCKITSLNGIQQLPKIQCLELLYNRSLKDITALKDAGKTLRLLRIDHCANITDFSVLDKLESLELLELTGCKPILNLNFLKTMKSLKTFIFDVDILDGDLSDCMKLQYVGMLRYRKHYSHKESDMPKGPIVRGNENISKWRRFE